MLLSNRNEWRNPDYFELHEADHLAKCDICKKDKFFTELEVFNSPQTETSILMCASCYEKLKKGENLNE